VEASLEGLPVAARDLVILGTGDYRRLLNTTAAEDFTTAREGVAFNSTATWRRSWVEVLDYSNAGPCGHIVLNAAIEENEHFDYRDLGLQRFEFAAFHINRFVFERAMFGGRVSVSAQNGRSLSISVRTAFRSTTPAKLPPYISLFQGVEWSGLLPRLTFSSSTTVDSMMFALSIREETYRPR
jgi:hypothetical protein